MVARVPRGLLSLVLAILLVLAVAWAARTLLPDMTGEGRGQGAAGESGAPGSASPEPGYAVGPVQILQQAVAVADIQGGPLAPEIQGQAAFFPVEGGALVAVRVDGLPTYTPATEDQEPIGPHGFHVHEFGTCEVGDPDDPFLAAGGHWDPDGQPHGDHAGDFPVLFSNLGEQGFAFMTFFTDEFEPAEVVGRSVLIHLYPNDYRTQPAGASGPRLACGVIQAAD